MRIHRYEPLIWIAAVFLAACSLGQNEEQADIIESDSSVQVTDTHVATQETPQQVTDIPSVTPTQGGFQPDATSEEDPEEATQQVRDRIPPEGRWQMTYYDGEIICDSVTDEIPTTQNQVTLAWTEPSGMSFVISDGTGDVQFTPYGFDDFTLSDFSAAIEVPGSGTQNYFLTYNEDGQETLEGSVTGFQQDCSVFRAITGAWLGP